LGVTTYFGGAPTRTLKRAVDEFGALAIGEDPLQVEAPPPPFRDRTHPLDRHRRRRQCHPPVIGGGKRRFDLVNVADRDLRDLIPA
jgi:hypothetical protein